MATQSHKACVYCSSRLGFPTRLFFRTGGHCSISSLVAALCLSRARKSSSACRSGQFVAGGPTRRVKNRSMGKCKQLRFRAENTCIQQLIQQQWLCSTVDTAVTVTCVDALFTFIIINIHEHGPLSSTSIVNREERGCGHVHPCCRSCLCKLSTTLSRKMCSHRSKAAEQLHGVLKPLITSTICSWIGKSMIRCTRLT